MMKEIKLYFVNLISALAFGLLLMSPPARGAEKGMLCNQGYVQCPGTVCCAKDLGACNDSCAKLTPGTIYILPAGTAFYCEGNIEPQQKVAPIEMEKMPPEYWICSLEDGPMTSSAKVSPFPRKQNPGTLNYFPKNISFICESGSAPVLQPQKEGSPLSYVCPEKEPQSLPPPGAKP